LATPLMTRRRRDSRSLIWNLCVYCFLQFHFLFILKILNILTSLLSPQDVGW
jgi:hypothetical protein